MYGDTKTGSSPTFSHACRSMFSKAQQQYIHHRHRAVLSGAADTGTSVVFAAQLRGPVQGIDTTRTHALATCRRRFQNYAGQVERTLLLPARDCVTRNVRRPLKETRARHRPFITCTSCRCLPSRKRERQGSSCTPHRRLTCSSAHSVPADEAHSHCFDTAS